MLTENDWIIVLNVSLDNLFKLNVNIQRIKQNAYTIVYYVTSLKDIFTRKKLDKIT